jgi:hypothetical protein
MIRSVVDNEETLVCNNNNAESGTVGRISYGIK